MTTFVDIYEGGTLSVDKGATFWTWRFLIKCLMGQIWSHRPLRKSSIQLRTKVLMIGECKVYNCSISGSPFQHSKIGSKTVKASIARQRKGIKRN